MRFSPERVCIGRCNRDGLALDNSRITPPCGGVERHIDTSLNGHLFKQLHVQATHLGTCGLTRLIAHTYHGLAGIVAGCCIIFGLASIGNGPWGSRMLHLVLNLTADNRSAILIIQALQLLTNLGIESLDDFQIFGIVTTHLQGLGKQPVGETATANLAMAERADTHNHLHIVLFTKLDKAAQVTLTIPTELALNLLVQVPEHIGGNNGHATRLHLQDLLFPLLGRVAAVVELAHHWDDRLACHRHIETVHINALALRIYTTHTQVVATYRLWLCRLGKLVHLLCLHRSTNSQCRNHQNKFHHIYHYFGCKNTNIILLIIAKSYFFYKKSSDFRKQPDFIY